jgi:hypothetical protein
MFLDACNCTQPVEIPGRSQSSGAPPTTPPYPARAQRDRPPVTTRSSPRATLCNPNPTSAYRNEPMSEGRHRLATRRCKHQSARSMSACRHRLATRRCEHPTAPFSYRPTDIEPVAPLPGMSACRHRTWRVRRVRGRGPAAVPRHTQIASADRSGRFKPSARDMPPSRTVHSQGGRPRRCMTAQAQPEIRLTRSTTLFE